MHGSEGTELCCASSHSAQCRWSCLVCIISVKTSRNGKHFKADAVLFLVLPDVKVGACSIFGNFCVGGSKEGMKRIPRAVKWRHNKEFYFWSPGRHFGRVRCCRFNIQMQAQCIRNVSGFFSSVERFVLEYSIILITSCVKIWKLIPKIPQVQAGSHGGAELWLPKPGESANRGTRDKLQALFFFFKCFIHFRVCLPV